MWLARTLALLWALATLPAHAEDVSARYLRTAIFVNDRAATVKFFRDVLGYTEAGTAPVEHPSAAIGLPADAKVMMTALSSKDGAGLSIMGVESSAFPALARPGNAGNASGDVMLVHQVTGIREIYARAQAGGYEVLLPPQPSPSGKSLQMILRDPNRVRLELYEMLPPAK